METEQLNWIDTHCHLYVDEFDQDRDAMISRALDSGVSGMMLPNIDEASISGMWALVNRYPKHCMPMMGLHPCSVKADYREVLSRMEADIKSRPYVGVGETGIDLYWDKTYVTEQIDAFEIQIEWAKTLDLPVIIHSRESLELTIDIISRHQDGRLKGIFHCFSGEPAQVEQIDNLGFKVGIGGVVTFKKAGLAELLPHIPLNMMVLETDSPYLAPVPHRGKRNEPAYCLLVASKISEVLGLSLEEVSRITTENAASVYGKKD
jgi:TatD DNase family protein